jgi:hypothetical protein
MPDQFQLAQVPLSGAETLNQPDFPVLEAQAPRQPGVFGGKLLPERGLLANILVAGLLGLSAGAGARTPGQALAGGVAAPFQFRIQQRQRQQQEELQQAELEDIRGRTAARATTELRQGDLLEIAKMNATRDEIRFQQEQDTFPLKIQNMYAQLSRNVAQTLKAQGYKVSSPEEFDAAKEKGLPAITKIVDGKIQFFTIDDPNKVLPAYAVKVPGQPDIKVPSAPSRTQDAVLATELKKSFERFKATIKSDPDLRREQLNNKFNALIEDGDNDPAKISSLFIRRRGQGLYTADEARAIGQLLLQGFQIQETAARAPFNLPPGTGAQDFVGATAIPIEKPTDEQLRDEDFKGLFREISPGEWVAELTGDVLDTPEKVTAMLQLLANSDIRVKGIPGAAPAADPEKESLRDSINRLTGDAKQKLIDVLDELNLLKKEKP